MSKLKTPLDKQKVLGALSKVNYEGNTDVVTSGVISSVVIKGDSVGFAIEVDFEKAAEKEALRKECEKAVKSIAGVKNVTAVLTSSKPGSLVGQKNVQSISSSKNKSMEQKIEKRIPGVKKIIMVIAGKGGVGKSTVSVNLARQLAKTGNSVAIADMDIYGPSVPNLLGIEGKPEIDDNNKMRPKEKDGLKSVSIGYIVEPESAVIWRSSMALKALHQLLRGTNWGQTDYLIIDTPPGTGDIHLTLAQSYDIEGAVVVSTPQEVALIDVRKAIAMMRKVNVPILGMIENMSYFEDATGKKNYIFGKSGGKELAKSEAIDFLGEIPIREDLRIASDKGKSFDDFKEMQEISAKLEKILEKN